MHFQLYTDVHTFYRDVYDVLMRDEPQNIIPLGNLIMGHEGKDKTDWRDPVNWLMAAVADEEGIKLTAVMTPPHKLTLYATGNIISTKAIGYLIDGLKDREIPGVVTEKKLAECFAKECAARKGLKIKTEMEQRIYELTAVNPDVKKMGTVRLATEKDMHFFPYWYEAFCSRGVYGKNAMAVPKDAEQYRYRIAGQKLYILEVDGLPVSMASLTLAMQTAIGVSFVYTPPYFCNRGYATSAVAQVSALALGQGFNRCVLYTDLANPTSNSIYQKIGYVPVCDSLQLAFEK